MPGARFCIGVLWHPEADVPGSGQAAVRRAGIVLPNEHAAMAPVRRHGGGEGRRGRDRARRGRPACGTRTAASTSTPAAACGTARSATAGRELADAAAAQMRLLAAYDTFDRLANRPALDLAERVSDARAVRRRRRVLHERRLRGGRHRRQARPPLLARARTAREADHRPPPARLPRHERLRHEPRRHPVQPRGLRHAHPGRRLGLARRSRRARRVPGRARRPGRGVHRRARDRRGRHPAPTAPATGPRCRRCAAATTCCSSPTRSSPASGGSAAGSAASGSGSSPT